MDSFKPYADLFLKPKGPGDARPTAMQVIRDNALVNKWAGKVVLVTGGTSGLGLETARALHATGADVFITARDFQKAQAVIANIAKSSAGSGKLDVVEMDMNSLGSVKNAAQAFLSKSPKLNVLVNNAGIMATPEGSKTSDGFEQQFGVNHLAHFTLTVLLLPTLLKSSTSSFNSRVVALTSSGHRYSAINWDDVNFSQGYNPWVAYGQSKTANIWMATYIDRVYGPRGLHANSVHPGGILTPLHQHVPAEMVEARQQDQALMDSLLSPEQGAATTTWAASAPVWEGKGGQYLCDCGQGGLAKDMMAISDPGYAPHAFDREGEERLWKLSLELAGIEAEV
ncbi:retinol dehydrogenase 14 [Colletotrichum spaethianum]|uniref:Retinol dehydrogenase 14 n=1 Tax=Colletotrichum spaethianum TaxID=700344 RepID=A0AA37P7N2_9PEZI|nr:retinol dehydrogenase 14 [Colletotrichum spaethianum]GKT44794.1 retinol dehydrogenase 14 [Colletotrichum spaethianum]